MTNTAATFDPELSDAELIRFLSGLRAEADPDADSKVVGLVKTPDDFLAQAGRGKAPNSATFAAPVDDPRPSWAQNTDCIASGQRFFERFALQYGAALFLAALPACYASTKGARALMEVSSALSQPETVRRRIGETGRFLVDIFAFEKESPDGRSLDPGERGALSCNGVRTFHALVRSLLNEGGWDSTEFGKPVNQEDLLGTILAFSVVAHDGMARLGADIAGAPDREANLYVWKVVGSLLGVRPDVLRVLDVERAERVAAAIREDQYPRVGERNEDGIRLAAHLLATLEDSMPIFFRKVPRTLIWRCAPDRVAEVLEIPKAAWWAGALDLIDRDRKGPLSRCAGWLAEVITAKVGRMVFLRFIDATVDGDGRPWFPEQMKKRLRLRTGTFAKTTRRVRYVSRRTMRLAVPKRPVDALRLDERLSRSG